jgi:hypothetical protein
MVQRSASSGSATGVLPERAAAAARRAGVCAERLQRLASIRHG